MFLEAILFWNFLRILILLTNKVCKNACYTNFYCVENLGMKKVLGMHVICHTLSRQVWVPVTGGYESYPPISLLTVSSFPSDTSKVPIDNYRISVSHLPGWSWQKIWHGLRVLVNRDIVKIFTVFVGKKLCFRKYISSSFNMPLKSLNVITDLIIYSASVFACY